MQTEPMPEITGLLRAWRAGDGKAHERLIDLLYEELKRTAGHYMRGERMGHSLQTTALVNEAYIRLIGVEHVLWQDRVHFLVLAAQMMRRVLVDHARSRGYRKRGGGTRKVVLDESTLLAPDRDSEIVELDDALTELARHDSRKAKGIELRFFGGLSVEETAAVLEVSEQTVLRDWRLARAWLERYLSHRNDD